MPIILFWIFIAGGQYYVGTDYPSYLQIFNGQGLEQFYDYGEYGFWWITKICFENGIKGQALFFVYYTIGFIFIFLFIRKSKIQYIWIFILLYITYTSLFNNQLNGLRQTISVYIGCVGALCVISKEYVRGLVLFLIAISFHLTSIIFLLFFLNKIIVGLTRKQLLVLLGVSLLCSFALSPNLLDEYVDILPIKYASLIENGEIEKNNPINIISKLLFFPIVLYAMLKMELMNLSNWERALFIWGILGFCIRTAFLGLSLVGRMGMGFLLFSIFPMYYLLVYLRKSNDKNPFYIIIAFLILYYFIKVVAFPIGEYDYHNFIFK